MANGNSTLVTKVIDAMLGVKPEVHGLEDYLPAPTAGLPAPSLSLVSVAEQAVGLGNRVGNDTRGPFSVAALKGLRIEAVVRYQLWASAPADVEKATRQLISNILGDRDRLRKEGFLHLALTNTGLSENVPAVTAWRQNVEFSVLYEFPYTDSDGAESLIARIPINVDSEFDEATVVTDEMTRWDNKSAPALVLRGRLIINRLSALFFIPGTAPSGTITLTRTFDGAVGPPPDHPNLAAFLAAITAPDNPARQGRVTFASLNNFLAAFTAAGSAIKLGDWDENTLPDEYESRALAIEPPIKLPSATDRLDIAYQNSAFDQVAVVYLRATRGLTT
ncbi:MAG TPA: hypothetical protein VKD91_10815 [Pyrinomonadaceae bacterium]|nr:hypothetical protein [Pyrinomonadaceae bacterium]